MPIDITILEYAKVQENEKNLLNFLSVTSYYSFPTKSSRDRDGCTAKNFGPKTIRMGEWIIF